MSSFSLENMCFPIRKMPDDRCEVSSGFRHFQVYCKAAKIAMKYLQAYRPVF